MNMKEHIENAEQFKGYRDCYVHIEVKDGKCASFSTGDTLSTMLSCTDTLIKVAMEGGYPEGLLFQIIYDRLKEAQDAEQR